jgi:hypothetical protein
MTAKRPILVTGSIRAGTTWVGRMISESPTVGYIHEPLNPWEKQRTLGICSARVPCWFLYITKENQSVYHEHIRNTLEFRYNLIGGLRGMRSLKDVERVLQEYRTFRMYRSCDVRPLVKDPFALFSAEWFAETFGMDVVILIRHPAAFVSSLKRLKWGFPFWHLLKQPLLMRDHLHSFETQLKECESERCDVIDQAILLWNILYYVVVEYRKKHKDWVFLRHEDISRDPQRCFQDLFVRLGLDFSSQVESAIQEHSDPSNPSEVPIAWAYALKRDSRSAIWSWKDRLTKSEIERIREGSWDIAQEFYSDDDW